MDNQYYKNEANQIVSELYDEFSKEELKLKVKVDNNCAKLEELDQQIRALSRTEDIEMKVFSPRKSLSSESDKVSLLKKEREALDKQNREDERDYRYYSKRAEKLRYLSDLFEKNGDFLSQSSNSYVSNQIVEKDVKPKNSVSTDDLEMLQKRMYNVYRFIEADIQRAKVEMKNLMLLVQDLIVKND